MILASSSIHTHWDKSVHFSLKNLAAQCHQVTFVNLRAHLFMHCICSRLIMSTMEISSRKLITGSDKRLLLCRQFIVTYVHRIASGLDKFLRWARDWQRTWLNIVISARVCCLQFWEWNAPIFPLKLALNTKQHKSRLPVYIQLNICNNNPALNFWKLKRTDLISYQYLILLWWKCSL